MNNKQVPEEKTCVVPLEEQRQSALEHYLELAGKACHWNGFVEAAIKAYNPASLPAEPSTPETKDKPATGSGGGGEWITITVQQAKDTISTMNENRKLRHLLAEITGVALYSSIEDFKKYAPVAMEEYATLRQPTGTVYVPVSANEELPEPDEINPNYSVDVIGLIERPQEGCFDLRNKLFWPNQESGKSYKDVTWLKPIQPEREGVKSMGVDLIAKERQRQIEVEGWNDVHDIDHKDGQMVGAAMCYTANALNKSHGEGFARAQVYGLPESDFLVNSGDRGDRRISKGGWKDAWPWDVKWDKRKKHGELRSLVIAGALIAAEIDRLTNPPEKE